MSDTPEVPAPLALRLAVASERLVGEVGKVAELGQRIDRLESAVERVRADVKPAIDAHTAYLARLQAAENATAAEAVAATKGAEERAREAEAKAREAQAKEEEERANARTAAWRLALQVAIPLLAGALGIGGTWYALDTPPAPAPTTSPAPAQDAPGVPS